jgi:hypothetical protein
MGRRSVVGEPSEIAGKADATWKVNTISPPESRILWRDERDGPNWGVRAIPSRDGGGESGCHPSYGGG